MDAAYPGKLLEPSLTAGIIRGAAKDQEGSEDVAYSTDYYIWKCEASESFIRSGLYVIQALSQAGIAIHYSLTALKVFLSDEPMRLALLRQFFKGEIGELVPNEGYKTHHSARDQLDAMPDYLRDAFHYFLVVYPTTAAEIRNIVAFTADAWLYPLVVTEIAALEKKSEQEGQLFEDFKKKFPEAASKVIVFGKSGVGRFQRLR